MADCKNCIHIEVCKTADSCDGRVPGCRHFEPKTKHGRWIMGVDEAYYDYGVCSVCGFAEREHFPCLYTPNYCPDCGAIMDLPSITDQTMKALETMDRKAHGGNDDG